jgi:hypothetical protein
VDTGQVAGISSPLDKPLDIRTSCNVDMVDMFYDIDNRTSFQVDRPLSNILTRCTAGVQPIGQPSSKE